MKILFLIPYPIGLSPSQRFRFEQYIKILSDKGYVCTFQSFLDSHSWQIFFRTGNLPQKALCLVTGFARRVKVLFGVSTFDFVFIHREATPIGPPIIEWIIAKVLNKRIIYDFDDAIWMTDRPDESIFLSALKWRTKVRSICGWSYKISCGNTYLCNYSRQFNSKVIINPTTIDVHVHNPVLNVKRKFDELVIGWTGSHSTLKYLVEIEPILKELENRNKNLKILVIADKRPQFLSLNSVQFIPWSKETEIEDLLKMDIGIMPLPADEWSKGKCGFKALQYMALGIPPVASRVGTNSEIIEDNINGFLCSTKEEWLDSLQGLIDDESLCFAFGESARKKVIEHYSVSSNSSNFLSLFT